MISLDLDGNDFHLVKKLLETGVSPDLFIVEYNGKFPPSVDFIMDYNASHVWQSDDYYGASLKSYNKLFLQFDYTLVCCNATGANAFFVKTSHIRKFADVPKNIEELYVEPFYFLRNKKMHRTSTRLINQLINCDQNK